MEAVTLEAPEFLASEGRLPRLGDPVPPWAYRGWLLYYVQAAESLVRGDASRWEYYGEACVTGRLPDRPIPRLAFGSPDPAASKALLKWAELVGGDRGGWSDFRTLVDWFAWGLALTRTPPRYPTPGAAEALYKAVDVSVLLRAPYDYWGATIAERIAPGWNSAAFYPTPHGVCELLALANFGGADAGVDTRGLKVHDPCVGTGRMLLHASNDSMRLYGQDVDPLVLACCKINGALYAPWLAYGAPDAWFAASPPVPESAAAPPAVPAARPALPAPAANRPAPRPVVQTSFLTD